MSECGGANRNGPRDNVWYVRIENWHPSRINEWDGRHWSVRARKKKFDRDLVAISLTGAGVPRAEGPRIVGLEIVLGPRQRGGDVDAYWKSTLDALVEAGALVDDGPRWVKLLPVTYSRATRPATVIRLEEDPDWHSNAMSKEYANMLEWERRAKTKILRLKRDVKVKAE